MQQMRTFAPRASDLEIYGPAACLLGRDRSCQLELSMVRSLDNRRRAALSAAMRRAGCGTLASSAAIRCASADRRSKCPGPASSTTSA
jgi:hypothetical protein